jgi:hypothetical protein
MTWNQYVTPFSYGMWLAVAMAPCALCVFLALTNFSKNSKQRLSLIDTVFYIPSCFCQQGQMANLLYELFINSIMLCLVDFFNFVSLCGIFLPFILDLIFIPNILLIYITYMTTLIDVPGLL